MTIDERHFEITDQRANDLHLINYLQTPQERRDKYLILTDAGFPPARARRMRDWRWPKVNQACLTLCGLPTPFKNRAAYRKATANV